MLTALPVGDDLALSLFFAGVGVTFVIPSIQERGWKRWFFAGCGFICVCFGLFWPTIRGTSPVVNRLAVDLARSGVLQWVGGGVSGLFIGWYASRWASRKDRKVRLAAISREDLSARAGDLAAKLLVLVGQHEGRMRAAFIADARHQPHDGARSAEADGYLLEVYAERYAKEVSFVINTAIKMIPMNKDHYWRGFQNFRSGRDIPELASYLAKLSIELLHPIPDLPMHSPLMEEQQRRVLTNPPTSSHPSPMPPAPPTET